MKVGLFFGTFNPIHNGHLFISERILNNTGIDEIWLVISPKSPHKIYQNILDKNLQLVFIIFQCILDCDLTILFYNTELIKV